MCLGWPWLLTFFSDHILKTAMSQPVANCSFDHFGVSMLQQSSIQHRIPGFPTYKGIVNHWSRKIVSTNYQLLIFQFYSCMTAKSPLDSNAKLLDLLLSGKKRTDQQTCGDMQLCHDFNFNRPFVPWLDSIQLTYPLETSSYRYWIGKKQLHVFRGCFWRNLSKLKTCQIKVFQKDERCVKTTTPAFQKRKKPYMWQPIMFYFEALRVQAYF